MGPCPGLVHVGDGVADRGIVVVGNLLHRTRDFVNVMDPLILGDPYQFEAFEGDKSPFGCDREEKSDERGKSSARGVGEGECSVRHLVVLSTMAAAGPPMQGVPAGPHDEEKRGQQVVRQYAWLLAMARGASARDQ